MSIGLNRLLLKFSTNLGARETGEVRFASTATPSLGGISFYIIFILGFLSILFLYPEYLLENTKQTAGLFTASTLGFLLGFADDAYNTNPTLKFIGQIVCAVVLVFSDLYIPLVPDVIQGAFFWNTLFTIIWVVALMNSLNMLDNMDAITTTVSISILIIALIVLSINGFEDVFLSLLIIIVLATLYGFLRLNWHPASMYMGDTGSQFIGVFLAAVSIHLFWNFKDNSNQIIQIKQFLIPLLAFMMPIIDTTTVFIRRLLRGHSPFVGGADHTTHHLAFLGVRIRWIAVIFGFLNLISIVGIVLILNVQNWHYYYNYIVITYFLLLFLFFQFLYDLGAKKKPSRLRTESEN